ncbi:MAG: HAMP domain-containing histidine kinase [Lachnospiraceae bacterium]|nr:HAMP domain-containing histidine kinase [Lachnospiraceae bacterium]
MKKTTIIAAFLLTLLIEITAGIYLISRIRDLEMDPVTVNECMYSVTENFGHPDRYDRSLNYVVIDPDGTVLFKTKEGLSESVNEAIRNRGLILDLVMDDQTVGKVIFDYDMGEQIASIKRTILIGLIVISAVQVLLLVIWFIYFRKTILKPFKNLNQFAERVAQGNLDLPLPMDKGHVFGAFSESFDLMRSELKKARAAEKKASDDKKEMVAKLSHDIKTPVASIKSTSEIGLEVTKEERTRKMFGVINDKTDQIKVLVDNLFNSSVQDITEIVVNPGMQPSSVLLGLIERADYLNRAEAFEIPECNVFADKLRLQQVFDNIFMNSYKYADTKIEVKAQIAGDYLVIRFRDHGPGVPEEELPLLTEKYRRGSNATDQDGAGLGLYLTEYFLEKMDGQLGLKNAEPGLEVSVYLRLS